MHTKPIREPGAREPLYWFLVKQVWCKVKYNENHNRITKKDFFKNFLKYCKDISFDWTYKDKEGNLKYPTEDDYDYAAMACFKKYKWDACAESYEEYEMPESLKRAIKIRKKGIEKRTLKNMEHYDDLDALEDRLIKDQKSKGAHNEYRIRAIEESKSAILTASDKELGLDETKLKIDGKLDAKVKPEIPPEVKLKRIDELAKRMEKMDYD